MPGQLALGRGQGVLASPRPSEGAISAIAEAAPSIAPGSVFVSLDTDTAPTPGGPWSGNLAALLPGVLFKALGPDRSKAIGSQLVFR